MWQKFTEDFYFNFIEKERWLYLVDGLKITLTVTLLAVILGIVIGLIVGVIRSTYEKTHKLKILNFICNLYLTVIRGTPVVVQLMIIYYVIFGSLRVDKVPVAVLAFGINSGAYVAEIFRSGIMSIDNGQFEAGRSLGFNYPQTMWYIIMPQAFKNILPALSLAKEKINHLIELTGDLYASDMHELMFIYELKERLTVCLSVIAHLGARKETRWHSFAENLDYPHKSDDWMKYVNSKYENGQLHMIYRELVGREARYEHND